MSTLCVHGEGGGGGARTGAYVSKKPFNIFANLKTILIFKTNTS